MFKIHLQSRLEGFAEVFKKVKLSTIKAVNEVLYVYYAKKNSQQIYRTFLKFCKFYVLKLNDLFQIFLKLLLSYHYCCVV